MIEPVKANVSAIERAFELAATGRYVTVTEIKRKLMREGYEYEQVAGPVLSKQLSAAITKARNGGAPPRK
jgi:hypothetical protein